MDISKKRYGRLTILGAIGNVLRKPCFVMGDSTNATDVLELLEMVVANLPTSQRPYIIFDGHRAHRARIVKAYMEEHFVPMQMPKHSCEFNVQEKVWRAVKMRNRAGLSEMSARQEVTELQFWVLVNMAYRSISNRFMHRQLTENDDHIREYLGD